MKPKNVNIYATAIDRFRRNVREPLAALHHLHLRSTWQCLSWDQFDGGAAPILLRGYLVSQPDRDPMLPFMIIVAFYDNGGWQTYLNTTGLTGQEDLAAILGAPPPMNPEDNPAQPKHIDDRFRDAVDTAFRDALLVDELEDMKAGKINPGDVMDEGQLLCDVFCKIYGIEPFSSDPATNSMNFSTMIVAMDAFLSKLRGSA